MLKIFHAPKARSIRIVWLCEEMGAPYQVQIEKFGNPSPDFLAANPLKALPALVDGDVCMIESVAMMIYIMSKYGPTTFELKPGEPDYPRYLQFLIFGEAGMAMYGNPLVATKFFAPDDKRDNWTVDYLKGAMVKRTAFVEDALGDREFIAGGRFTAADISVGYSLGMVGFAADMALSPKLQAYVDRLQARPAYQRALASA
ncbi:MAG TPA: glutathione S-transferase [Caulobacterales bacterium]|nr:glutathione S-transferase [Caulobacterales bacterium]